MDDVDERKSRLGQEGYAQVAEGLQMGTMGVAGEREKVDEVVDGGESVDLDEILTGFAKADSGDGTDGVEDKDDGDKSRSLSPESRWSLENVAAMVKAECGEERWVVVEKNMKTFGRMMENRTGLG